jgi:hypothetical protein
VNRPEPTWNELEPAKKTIANLLYGVKTCTGGSNPPLSANNLQPALLLKRANCYQFATNSLGHRLLRRSEAVQAVRRSGSLLLQPPAISPHRQLN